MTWKAYTLYLRLQDSFLDFLWWYKKFYLELPFVYEACYVFWLDHHHQGLKPPTLIIVFVIKTSNHALNAIYIGVDKNIYNMINTCISPKSSYVKTSTSCHKIWKSENTEGQNYIGMFEFVTFLATHFLFAQFNMILKNTNMICCLNNKILKLIANFKYHNSPPPSCAWSHLSNNPCFNRCHVRGIVSVLLWLQSSFHWVI